MGKTQIITTELLGKAELTQAPYENYNGEPLVIDADYFGNKRDPKNPTPGPFEGIGTGRIKLKVW